MELDQSSLNSATISQICRGKCSYILPPIFMNSAQILHSLELCLSLIYELISHNYETVRRAPCNQNTEVAGYLNILNYTISLVVSFIYTTQLKSGLSNETVPFEQYKCIINWTPIQFAICITIQLPAL